MLLEDADDPPTALRTAVVASPHARAGGVTHEIVVGGEPTEVRRARRFVQQLVEGMCSDLADTAVLLTSEVVTNAIIHGRSEARVQVTLGDERVRVEVADDNSRPPAVQATDDDALDGRGLMILTTAADDWGVHPAGIGKVVWFELTCRGAGHAHGCDAAAD